MTGFLAFLRRNVVIVIEEAEILPFALSATSFTSRESMAREVARIKSSVCLSWPETQNVLSEIGLFGGL